MKRHTDRCRHRLARCGALLGALLGVLLGVWLAPPAQAVDTLRCGSRLVSTDMTAAEVIAACGEPSFRDVWSQDGAYGGGLLGYAEEWTYNFGSSQLLRVLRFRNGRLQRIDTEGYGFAEDRRGDCAQSGITPGMSKYRLIAACGEPLTRTVEVTQVPYETHRRQPHGFGGSSPKAQFWETVLREEWVYNFGAARFMRVVRLENARVVEVETAGRGFDSR